MNTNATTTARTVRPAELLVRAILHLAAHEPLPAEYAHFAS